MSESSSMKSIAEENVLSSSESNEGSPRMSQARDSAKSGVTSVDDIQIPDEDKTTVMVRNLPNRYTQEKFLEVLKNARDTGRCGIYDFVYIPVDLKRKCNAG